MGGGEVVNGRASEYIGTERVKEGKESDYIWGRERRGKARGKILGERERETERATKIYIQKDCVVFPSAMSIPIKVLRLLYKAAL